MRRSEHRHIAHSIQRSLTSQTEFFSTRTNPDNGDKSATPKKAMRHSSDN
jgi:hypothetical protein